MDDIKDCSKVTFETLLPLEVKEDSPLYCLHQSTLDQTTAQCTQFKDFNANQPIESTPSIENIPPENEPTEHDIKINDSVENLDRNGLKSCLKRSVEVSTNNATSVQFCSPISEYYSYCVSQSTQDTISVDNNSPAFCEERNLKEVNGVIEPFEDDHGVPSSYCDLHTETNEFDTNSDNVATGINLCSQELGSYNTNSGISNLFQSEGVHDIPPKLIESIDDSVKFCAETSLSKSEDDIDKMVACICRSDLEVTLKENDIIVPCQASRDDSAEPLIISDDRTCGSRNSNTDLPSVTTNEPILPKSMDANEIGEIIAEKHPAQDDNAKESCIPSECANPSNNMTNLDSVNCCILNTESKDLSCDSLNIMSNQPPNGENSQEYIKSEIPSAGDFQTAAQCKAGNEPYSDTDTNRYDGRHDNDREVSNDIQSVTLLDCNGVESPLENVCGKDNVEAIDAQSGMVESSNISISEVKIIDVGDIISISDDCVVRTSCVQDESDHEQGSFVLKDTNSDINSKISSLEDSHVYETRASFPNGSKENAECAAGNSRVNNVQSQQMLNASIDVCLLDFSSSPNAVEESRMLELSCTPRYVDQTNDGEVPSNKVCLQTTLSTTYIGHNKLTDLSCIPNVAEQSRVLELSCTDFQKTQIFEDDANSEDVKSVIPFNDSYEQIIKCATNEEPEDHENVLVEASHTFRKPSDPSNEVDMDIMDGGKVAEKISSECLNNPSCDYSNDNDTVHSRISHGTDMNRNNRHEHSQDLFENDDSSSQVSNTSQQLKKNKDHGKTFEKDVVQHLDITHSNHKPNKDIAPSSPEKNLDITQTMDNEHHGSNENMDIAHYSPKPKQESTNVKHEIDFESETSNVEDSNENIKLNTSKEKVEFARIGPNDKIVNSTPEQDMKVVHTSPIQNRDIAHSKTCDVGIADDCPKLKVESPKNRPNQLGEIQESTVVQIKCSLKIETSDADVYGEEPSVCGVGIAGKTNNGGACSRLNNAESGIDNATAAIGNRKQSQDLFQNCLDTMMKGKGDEMKKDDSKIEHGDLLETPANVDGLLSPNSVTSNINETNEDRLDNKDIKLALTETDDCILNEGINSVDHIDREYYNESGCSGDCDTSKLDIAQLQSEETTYLLLEENLSENADCLVIELSYTKPICNSNGSTPSYSIEILDDITAPIQTLLENLVDHVDQCCDVKISEEKRFASPCDDIDEGTGSVKTTQLQRNPSLQFPANINSDSADVVNTTSCDTIRQDTIGQIEKYVLDENDEDESISADIWLNNTSQEGGASYNNHNEYTQLQSSQELRCFSGRESSKSFSLSSVDDNENDSSSVQCSFGKDSASIKLQSADDMEESGRLLASSLKINDEEHFNSATHETPENLRQLNQESSENSQMVLEASNEVCKDWDLINAQLKAENMQQQNLKIFNRSDEELLKNECEKVLTLCDHRDVEVHVKKAVQEERYLMNENACHNPNRIHEERKPRCDAESDEELSYQTMLVDENVSNLETNSEYLSKKWCQHDILKDVEQTDRICVEQTDRRCKNYNGVSNHGEDRFFVEEKQTQEERYSGEELLDNVSEDLLHTSEVNNRQIVPNDSESNVKEDCTESDEFLLSPVMHVHVHETSFNTEIFCETPAKKRCLQDNSQDAQQMDMLVEFEANDVSCENVNISLGNIGVTTETKQAQMASYSSDELVEHKNKDNYDMSKHSDTEEFSSKEDGMYPNEKCTKTDDELPSRTLYIDGEYIAETDMKCYVDEATSPKINLIHETFHSESESPEKKMCLQNISLQNNGPAANGELTEWNDQTVPEYQRSDDGSGEESEILTMYEDRETVKKSESPSPVKPLFKWKYFPSCDLDSIVPEKIDDDERISLLQPLKTCKKPLRLGLSRKHKYPSLHPSLKRE